jgi:hypothetical protein
MSLRQAFQKTLSANDVGSTMAHQAGIHIPKTEKALLDFLPPLDPKQRNPDAWIECVDEDGEIHRFRYVYYNNKLHDEGGTRNEYRITHMTGYLRKIGAKTGDAFMISRAATERTYTIQVIVALTAEKKGSTSSIAPVRLTGWNRVH